MAIEMSNKNLGLDPQGFAPHWVDMDKKDTLTVMRQIASCVSEESQFKAEYTLIMS